MAEHRMQCPACNVEMNVVDVQAHYGEPMLINQCPICGGIWFDADELYRINPKEAEKVDTLDVAKIRAAKEITNQPLECPHDGEKLAIFQDINFPKNLVVESCSVCNGFWFNHGEFKQFEEYRTEKIKASEPQEAPTSELDRQVNALLDLHSSQGTYDTLANMGKFLSSPVQSGSLRLGDVSISSAGTANLAGSVLTAVLRGMVGRI